jgi:small subunit ribosomal protein S20
VAHHPQAKKRNRQSVKKKARNISIKSYTRKTVGVVRAKIAQGDSTGAQEALSVAVKNLDKSVTKSTMRRKSASRTISRLVLAVNKLSSN